MNAADALKEPRNASLAPARSALPAWQAVLLGAAAACLVVPVAWAQPVRPAAGASAAAAPQRSIARTSESAPRWVELTAAQREALKPLAGAWSSLSEAQKRKWIAMSRNFDKLPPQEQQKLVGRMGEWVTLSASERSQARLNFAATKKLSVEDKQAQWQAYQALSEEERRKLADRAPHRAVQGAATALRPIPRQWLTTPPPSVDNPGTMPRIATPPHQVDRHTLLPQVERLEAGPSAP